MPEWVRVASTAECRDHGCLKKILASGEAIVLARREDEIFALEDRCSHEDFPLSEGEIVDGTLECVLHGARFDLRTGRALSLPAVRPVKTYRAEIRDGEIYVEIGR